MDNAHTTTRRNFLKAMPGAAAAVALPTAALATAAAADEPADLMALARRFGEDAKRMDPTLIGFCVGFDEQAPGPFENRVNGVFLSRSARLSRSAGKPAPSPMAKAISAHRRAWQAFDASCPAADTMEPCYSPEGAVKSERLCRAEDRKFMALLAMPASGGENRQRAEYLARMPDAEERLTHRHVMALLRSMAGVL